VVDNTGQVINYSTNSAQGNQGIVQQRTVMTTAQGGQTQVIQRAGGSALQMKPMAKPMKDPNAPKKPLSAYFLYSQEERLKVKEEYPEHSITEVAKELGRRWATLDPSIKQIYENRYQVRYKNLWGLLNLYNHLYWDHKHNISGLIGLSQTIRVGFKCLCAAKKEEGS